MTLTRAFCPLRGHGSYSGSRCPACQRADERNQALGFYDLPDRDGEAIEAPPLNACACGELAEPGHSCWFVRAAAKEDRSDWFR